MSGNRDKKGAVKCRHAAKGAFQWTTPCGLNGSKGISRSQQIMAGERNSGYLGQPSVIFDGYNKPVSPGAQESNALNRQGVWPVRSKKAHSADAAESATQFPS
jgi:hypothetical protein